MAVPFFCSALQMIGMMGIAQLIIWVSEIDRERR